MLLLCFWLLVEFQIAKGTSLTLTGSANYSVLDQTFRFTCTVTNNSSTEGIFLTFKTEDQATSCAVKVSTASLDPCTQVTTGTDYTCGCVSGQTGVYYMNISRVSVTQDEATWRCLRLSTNSNNVTLPVYYGPYSNVTINQTSTVTVIEDVNPSQTARCSAVCKPDCSYSWRKGTQEVSGSRDLSLGGFKRGQEGDYTCRAENTQTGESADSQTLTVDMEWYPAQPTHNCSDWIVLGRTGSCTCQTSDRGKPAGRVEWRNPDNQQISSSPSLSVQLSLASIPRSDNGRGYICRASNSLQNRDATYTVNIAYGPDANMVNLSKPTVIAEKNNVTLTCSTLTSVNPEVNFTWSWGDNTAITAGLGNKQGAAQRSWSQTLTVRAVRDSNRQEIRCDVINTQTSRRERVVVDLDVSYGPDSGEVQVSKSSTAVELEPLSLTCSTINNIKPGVTFTWTLDGSEVISGTGVIEGSPGGIWSQTLTLTPNRNQSSVGCTVINTVIDRQESSSVDLDVNYPPDISLPPVKGPQNTDLTVNCTATGNPSKYMFEVFRQYWGDQLIQRRGGTQTGDRYSLDLPEVSYQDSGVYICTVGNNVKQPSHKNTTVTVHASPVYAKDVDPTEPVGAEVGQTASLVQYIYCSPNFTSVSWHFNTTNTTTSRLSTDSSSVSSSQVHLDVYGTQVEAAGFKVVFTVTNFTKEHVGLYTVRVCNSVGCAESSLTLIGSGPPETPLHFTALNSTTDSVTLTWTPQYAGGDYTQEFHVEFRVQNTSGDWSSRVFLLSQDNSGAAVVDGLDSNTGYVFRIKSVTDRKTGNNTSPVSEEIYFSTKEVPKVTSPLPIGGIAGGIVAGLACFILVAVLLVFLRRRNLNKGGDRERLGSNDRNGDIVMEPNVLYETSGNVSREQAVMQKNDIYESADAVGGAEARTPEKVGGFHSELKKKKPEESVGDVYAEVKKTDKKQQKKKDAGKKDKGKKKDTTPAAKAKRARGDVYENAMLGQYGDDAITYANAGFEGDEPEAKNENPQPPTGRDADGCLYVGIDFGNKKPGKVIIGDEKSPYADIAFGRVGPPPAPDEEEEKKKDTVSK